MKKIIYFDFSTSNFDHAVRVCEVAFGYKGELWIGVKQSKNLDTLAEFLKSEDVDNSILTVE